MDKARRPCMQPGCPELTTHPKGCPAHRHQRGERLVYDRAWDLFATTYLREYPICQRCRQWRSEEVHHLIPARVAPHLRLCRTNVVALCHGCHSSITATSRRVVRPTRRRS